MVGSVNNGMRILGSDDIPGNWTRATVQQLLDIGALELVQDGNHGGNYPKPVEFANSGIPLITGADLTNGTIDFVACKYLRPESAARLRIGFAKPGDVLLSHKGTMGKTAIVPSLTTPYIVINPQLTLYRVSENGVLDRRYLRYYFDSAQFQSFLTRISAISTISTLSLGVQKSLEIHFPSISEQRAIAHILATLDDKIELNRRMNETLEAIARALFTSWFVDFDPVRTKTEGRDTGLPKYLADLFPDSFEDSELGEIPWRWGVGRIGDVADNPRRAFHPENIDPSTPYIALEHMPRRSIALSDWNVADGLESGKSGFRRGEILFGKLRPYFHKVGVAPVDGVCSTDIVVVIPRAEAWFGFVLGHVSSDAFVARTNAGSTGTKMPRTSWNEMARYPVVLPPDAIAKQFTAFVRPVVLRLLASIHESRTLADLRDALLPRLISGELRVRDVESMTRAGSA